MLKDKWESFSCTPVFPAPDYTARGQLAWGQLATPPARPLPLFWPLPPLPDPTSVQSFPAARPTPRLPSASSLRGLPPPPDGPGGSRRTARGVRADPCGWGCYGDPGPREAASGCRSAAPGGAGPRLSPQVATGRHPQVATFVPHFPGSGWRRGLRAVLVEREAAERRVDSARGGVRGLGLHRGLDPGSRRSEPATATSAARPRRLRRPGRQPRPTCNPAPSPPLANIAPPLSPPLRLAAPTLAADRAGPLLSATIGHEPIP